MQLGELTWTESGKTSAACPICANVSVKHSVVKVANPLGNPPVLEFFMCPGCRSLFPHPFNPPSYHLDEHPQMHAKFYAELGAGIDSMIGPLVAVSRHLKVTTFIDVGCGFGYTVDFARRILGWDAHGIDPGEYARIGKNVLHIPIAHEILGHGSRYDARMFDFVFSGEVLEHVTDPHDFLRVIFNTVKPGGCLILTTPSAEFVTGIEWPERVLAALSPGYHSMLFSKGGLIAALGRAGFSDVKVERQNERLVASAGRGVDAPALSWGTSTSYIYIRYLEALFNSDAEYYVRHGAAYRLFKELVNRGEFAPACAVWVKLESELVRQYDSKLLDAANLERLPDIVDSFEDYGKVAPYFLSCLLFYRGMFFLNADNAPHQAAVTFAAAERLMVREIQKPQAWFIETASLLWTTRYHKGVALLRAGDKSQAIAEFQRIIDAEHDGDRVLGRRALLSSVLVSRSLKDKGVALLQLGQLEQALQSFREVLSRPRESRNSELDREVRRLAADGIRRYHAQIGPGPMPSGVRLIEQAKRAFGAWRGGMPISDLLRICASRLVKRHRI
jgi:SAM-dependent methyltransferase